MSFQTPTFGRRAPALAETPVVEAPTQALVIGSAPVLVMAPPSGAAALRVACLERLDPSAFADMSQDRLQSEVERLIAEIADEKRIQLNSREQRQLASDLVDDMVGLGPLEPLLEDDSVTDIMVNGPDPGVRRAPRQTSVIIRPLPRYGACRYDCATHRRRGGAPGG